jgi:Kef-type K+ transport system membrane component KefB/mannitol/fructose-specific phosphotransferase system IIA component (Ntr-type)
MSLDLHQFSTMKGRSFAFGLLSFFIPQLAGVAVAMTWLGWNLPQALLVGSIVGSHTLLAYPVARRLGIVRNRAVTQAVGGSIFTDALALSLLAVAVAMAAGELTAAFWVQFTALVAAYALAVIFILPMIGRWFFRRTSGGGDVEFVFLMVVLFTAAVGAGVVGLAPIVGAFLAGLVMNRLVPDTGPLMNRLHFFGDALFIPFFVLSVGLLVDFRVLGQWEVWSLMVTLTLLVVLGKGAAAKLSQRIFRYTPSEGWTMVGLTIPQAAATLAVTLIGYQHGLFDEAMINAVVIMILLTCIAGPWLVETYGRQVAVAEEVAPYQPGQAPLRILIPLANPASAPALLDVAFMIRRPESPEPVYPLMVANEAGHVPAQVAAGEKMLGYAVIYAAGAGVSVVPTTRIDMNVASGITRAVKELRISTVVIGWTGAPSARVRHLGTVLDQVLQENPQTIIVCRFVGAINTTQRIVLVLPRLVERDPSFGEAMRTIRLLASKLGAKLVVIAHEAERSRLEQRLGPGGRIRPHAPTSVEPVASFHEVMPRLGSLVQDDDLLVVLSTREGRLAWTHDLARLPRRLVDRFPSHNLVVFYPSEATAETAWFSAPAVTLAGGLSLDASRAAIGLTAMEFGAAVEAIVAPHFGEQTADLRLVRDALVRSAGDYSTEVAPGMALLHAHVAPEVARMDRPTFFLATCPKGLDVPRVDRPVHVLLILISPATMAAEEHLRALAGIARTMQRPGIVERLLAVESFEQLQEALG